MKKKVMAAVPFILIILIFIVYNINIGPQPLFSDIKGHWAETDIEYWCEKGVMSGTDGRFNPDASVTVAQLATVLTRVLPLEEVCENRFDDVEEGQWYTEAVLKCAAAGILGAEGERALEPFRELSREEALVLFARAFRVEPVSGNKCLDEYNDSVFLSEDNAPYIEALLACGLAGDGNEVQLYPREKLTRAEVTAMLTKAERLHYI